MLSPPFTEQARQQGWDTICTIAKNNDFSLHIFHNLKDKIIKTQRQKYSHANTKKEMDHIHVS
jgi:hypothetical protein